MTSTLQRILFLCSSSVSGWFIMHAMGYLVKISDKRWKRFLMFINCLVLGSMIIFIGDLFNILATIACFLTTVFITCEGSLWQKITVGTMYASTIFSFNTLRDNYLKPIMLTHNPTQFNIYVHPYAGHAFVSLNSPLLYTQIISEISTLMFALLLYTGIRKFAPDKNDSLSDNLWRLLLLLTATPFGIVLSIVTLATTPDRYDFDSAFPTEYLALLIIALASFISLLWCITVLAKHRKLEQQNMLMEINRKYYETMEEQHFEIRRLKHDLSNHMQVLSALPPRERDSYIKNLTDHTAAIQPLSYCMDSTVNAVLSIKKTVMERHGIHIELSVDIPKELPYDKTDICALYANVLDNAIEACLKPDKDRRKIILKSNANKGLFCLEAINPMPGAGTDSDTLNPGYAPGNGCLPLTSKTDQRNHGLGLKSVREITARYHGNLELKIVEGMFDLFLYLPLS